ncbi:MAG: fatty acid desaturase family protein [Pseudomonadota bacterium]
MRTALFRHRADIPAALFVLAVFALQLTVFFLVEDPVDAIGWVVLLMLAQVSCGAICHNHHHVNIFTWRPLNRALEVVMYLQTGTSPFSWTIHHNIGHHHEYLDPQRDPSAWLHADGRPMSRIYYDLVNAAQIYPKIWNIGRQHPVLFTRFKRWFLISNLVLLGFFLVDPLMTLIVFIVPMLILLVLLLDNTFLQHSGLALDDHLVASRSVENRLYNLTSWNLGYHVAHHMQPGIHWTELPALHARIRAQIPPHLITTSLFGLPSAAERALRSSAGTDADPAG